MGIKPVKWATRDVGPMSSSQRLVLISLAEYADEDGTHAFPSVGTIAKNLELTPNTIRVALRELRNAGWIVPGDPQLVAKYRPDRRPSVYELVLTKVRDESGVSYSDERGVQGDSPLESSGVSEASERGVSEAPPQDESDTPRAIARPPHGVSVAIANPPYTPHIKDGVVGSNYKADSDSEKAHQQNDVDDLQEQMKVAGQTRRGWRPTDNALATAKDSVTEVSIEISIARYAVVKAEKKQKPTSAEWLRWLLADEQKAVADARRIQREKGKARPWHSVAD